MFMPSRCAVSQRSGALFLVLLSLALTCTGCGHAEREAESAVQTHYFKVDGMVQALGIT